MLTSMCACRSGARSLTPNLVKEAQLELQADMLPVMPRVVQGLDPSQESLLGLLETSAPHRQHRRSPRLWYVLYCSTRLVTPCQQLCWVHVMSVWLSRSHSLPGVPAGPAVNLCQHCQHRRSFRLQCMRSCGMRLVTPGQQLCWVLDSINMIVSVSLSRSLPGGLLSLLETSARIVNIVASPSFGRPSDRSILVKPPPGLGC